MGDEENQGEFQAVTFVGCFLMGIILLTTQDCLNWIPKFEAWMWKIMT